MATLNQDIQFTIVFVMQKFIKIINFIKDFRHSWNDEYEMSNLDKLECFNTQYYKYN